MKKLIFTIVVISLLILSIVGVNAESKSEVVLNKDPSCTKDSDCPQIKCIRDPCSINKCKDSKCVLIKDEENECDATNPCKEGDCIQLPGKPGFKCIKDPCSYCPGNTECIISATYPSRLYCNCKGDNCNKPTSDKGCISSKDLTTGEEITACPTEDKPVKDKI